MKRNLILTNVMILLFVLNYCVVNYNTNPINIELSSIRKVGITKDYDTGIFYQIHPELDDYYIETYDNVDNEIENMKMKYFY